MIYLNNKKLNEVKIGSTSGGSCNLTELLATENKEYIPEQGVDGYSKVTVNVPTAGGDADAQWKEIGYDKQPQHITDGIAYAKEIQAEWETLSITNKGNKEYRGDKRLRYYPLVDWSMLSKANGKFMNCSNLVKVPLLNTSSVTNFGNLFEGCTNLSYVPLFDTSSAIYFGNMFSKTGIIELPQFNTQNVTRFNNFLNDCKNLKTIPALNTSKCTDFSNSFSKCQSLVSLPYLDTKNGQDFSYMFYMSTALLKVEHLDFTSATNLDSIFYMGWSKGAIRYLDINNLGAKNEIKSIDFKALHNWGIDGDGITDCLKTLKDTLITNSYDRATAGYSACTITMAAETKALLSEDEKAAITAKGFTIA